MVDARRDIEVGIRVKTKRGEDDISQFSRFVKNEFLGLKRVVKVGAPTLGGGLAGAAQAFTSQLGQPLQLPFASDIAGAGAQGAITAGGAAAGALFGPTGAILGTLLGNQIGEAVKQALEGATAKEKFVRGGAVQDVQQIAAQFGVAGVDVSETELQSLLNQFKAQRQRQFSMMKRVVDLEGGQLQSTANLVRQSTGNVLRRVLGFFE